MTEKGEILVKKTSILLLLILASCLSSYAQGVAGMGAVSGTVRDATGAIVPGAAVLVSNEARGIRRNMISTEAGIFVAPALVPASGYSITVSLSGFKTWAVKEFDLQVGQTVDFKVTLEVAGASAEVSVTAEAPLVDETKSGVSEIVSQAQIDNLPINGRRVDSFVLLTPAVTNDGEFGLVSFRGIAMGNAFLTDGNDTTNSYYNENAGRTRISTQISQDAVQEFQVLSDGFSAEFGRAMGGVVNTVTRSGGNAMHGTGYWFFRNRSLNAADRYSTVPGAITPVGQVPSRFNTPEVRHQSGFSIGGPLKKDKVFYFFNTEIIRRNFPALNRIVNNSLTDSTGNNITAACTATAAQCTAATNFLLKQMNVLVPRKVSSAMGFLKLDWIKDEANTFSFSANVMHWRSPNGIQTQAVLTSGNALGNNGNSTVETRYGKASWTSIISPSMINEMRFGWFKDRLSDPAASDLWPVETGPRYVTVAGTTVGAAQAYPRTLPSEQRFQLIDNLTWTRGSHSVKLGYDFQTTKDWMNQLFNGNGGYAFASLTTFAQNFSGNTTGAKNYSTYSQAFGTAIHEFRTTDAGFYATDTYKRGRLTLNYGIRYEKAVLPQPGGINLDYPLTSSIPQSNKNIAPRFSASYFVNDKTVVRIGAGMFYARIHGNLLDTLFLGNGKFQTAISIVPTQAGAPVFPAALSAVGGFPGGTINIQYASKDFRTPYTEQGTLAIERQLSRGLGLTTSYIWSHGVQLITQRDVNLGAPGPTVTYRVNDTAGNQVNSFTTPVSLLSGRVNSNYARVLQVENGGQSFYNALAVQLNQREWHGLSAKLAYTWSHAIDTGNQQGANYNISSSFNNATYNGDYTYDKGSSTLDQRHRAVVNFMWSPKFTDNGSNVSRFLVNGWGLSGIVTLASPHPTSPTVNVTSTTQFPGVAMAYTTLNGSGGWNRVPFLPVASLNIDKIRRMDARLSRELPFSENVKANLTFEGFNIFNMQYNTSVNSTKYTATNGVLTPLANFGTGTSSQGFPDGTNARRAQVGIRLVF